MEEPLSPNETRLIRRAQRGDTAALGQVLQQYESRLFAIALTVLGSHWDAQDAVQETLLEACRRIRSLRKHESLRAWLTTTLMRKCYRLRASRRLVPVEELPDGETHTFVGTERDDEVFQAVAALPDEQRTVVALRFYLDLSYEEMAAVTGDPEGTVKSRLHRGMHRLRLALSEQRSQSGV